MSFLKALLIALAITMVLSYFFGSTVMNYVITQLDSHEVMIDSFNSDIVPLIGSILLIVVVAILLILFFGSIIFLLAFVLAGVFIAVLGAFWPLLLVVLFIYWCVKSGNTQGHCRE